MATRLERIQIVLTVLTPLMLGLGGLWFKRAEQRLNGEQQVLLAKQQDLQTQQAKISGQLSQLQTRTTMVQAMKEYFEMLVAADSSKGKMAAYALYMLNKEDPEMAVSLVLASDRPALRSVLVDLGQRDTMIRNLVAQRISSREGLPGDPHSTATRMTANATSVLAQMGGDERNGWSYLGTFRDGRWRHGPTVQIDQQMPQVDKSYPVAMSLYLRATAPNDEYRHGDIRGVIPVGDRLRVDELRQYGNRVWARVTVLHSEASATPMN